jgi:hypothetical protein
MSSRRRGGLASVSSFLLIGYAGFGLPELLPRPLLRLPDLLRRLFRYCGIEKAVLDQKIEDALPAIRDGRLAYISSEADPHTLLDFIEDGDRNPIA